MVYDADDAGQMATLRTLDIFIEEGMNVKVVSLPEGFDPDLFVRKNGIDNFKEIINKAENLLDYKLRILKSRYNIKEIEAKARISSEMLPTINKFKNTVLKSEYIKRLAQDLDIEEDALLQELKKVKEDRVYLDLNQAVQKKVLHMNPTERLLIKLMLEEKKLIERIKDSLEPADFRGEESSRIVSIMFDLAQQGKSLEPSNLINYLDDDGISQVICESTFLPNISSQDKDKILDDCIRRLKSERLRFKRQQLHDQIKTAQDSGDEERLHRLVQEFQQLTKKGKPI